MSMLECHGNKIVSSYTIPATITDTTLSPSVTIISKYYLIASMIQINWRNSDREAASASAQTSLPHRTARLSTGDIATIAISIPVATITAFLVVIFCLRRRRKRYLQRQIESTAQPHVVKPITDNRMLELDVSQETEYKPIHEAEYTSVYEAEDHPVYEADSGTPRHSR